MAIVKIYIDQFLELAKDHPIIDVRSPAEYQHAHIPGAYSLPLFTDEERKMVGTAYKQESREKAIKLGLDFFGPKMRQMVEEVESLVNSYESIVYENSRLSPINSLLIYCWRGGMRSEAVARLMDLYGFKVYTLVGGYKKFRNYVLDTFKLPFQFKVLGGYTGSGKTETLKALRQKGELVIDLEDIAKHKGSAFGNIGMPAQPTQEMFENVLSCELRKILEASPEGGGLVGAWLEDESQRIGNLNIPHDLWNTMRQSPVYFLDIPFDERLTHIVREYGGLERQSIIDAIGRIREKLGGLNAKTAIRLLEEGNTIESFRILLEYYDRFYFKALHNREQLNSLLYTVECNSVTSENASQLIHHPQYETEKL